MDLRPEAKKVFWGDPKQVHLNLDENDELEKIACLKTADSNEALLEMYKQPPVTNPAVKKSRKFQDKFADQVRHTAWYKQYQKDNQDKTIKSYYVHTKPRKKVNFT